MRADEGRDRAGGEIPWHQHRHITRTTRKLGQIGVSRVRVAGGHELLHIHLSDEHRRIDIELAGAGGRDDPGEAELARLFPLPDLDAARAEEPRIVDGDEIQALGTDLLEHGAQIVEIESTRLAVGPTPIHPRAGHE